MALEAKFYIRVNFGWEERIYSHKVAILIGSIYFFRREVLSLSIILVMFWPIFLAHTNNTNSIC